MSVRRRVAAQLGPRRRVEREEGGGGHGLGEGGAEKGNEEDDRKRAHSVLKQWPL